MYTEAQLKDALRTIDKANFPERSAEIEERLQSGEYLEEDEPGRSNSKLEKPDSITLAIKLIWFTLVLSGLSTSYLLFSNPELRPVLWLMLVSLVFGLSISIALVINISAAKNWARIAYLVLYLISVVSFARNVAIGLDYSVIDLLSTLVNHLVSIYVFMLLFSKSGNQWFRGEKQEEP